MKKYKTKATKAEEQILELLKDNKNIHLPWGLVKKTLVNRTLDCTADEVRIIFENNANVRPGFEVNDDTVFSPNLLVKFSGIDDNTRYFQRISDLKSLINTFAYENFNGFCDNPMDEMNLKVYFNDDGSLNSSKLLHSDCFQFSYLRREYQILLLKKFEEIINHKNEYFMSSTAALPDTDILQILLNIDGNLISAFNEFDFQRKPPALIFNNNKKSKLSPRQAFSLLLLNLLGFDIIVISGFGYAEIENQFNPEIYALFYSEKITRSKKMQTRTKILISVASVILTSGIIVGSILAGNSNKQDIPNNIVQDQQTEDIVNDEPEDSEDKVEVPDNSEADNPQQTDSIEGVTMNFTEETGKSYLESIIDIYINDPDGNPIDMSKVSYTIARGDTTISRDFHNGHDPAWLEGPVFEVITDDDKIQINSKEDGINFYYVLTYDSDDYSFLLQGQISKEDYSDHRRMDLIFNLGGLNNTYITATSYYSSSNRIGFYAFSDDSIFKNMIDADFLQGCYGSLDISTGKLFYSNLEKYRLFAYYKVADGLVFYDAGDQMIKAPELMLRLDHRGFLTRTVSINPALEVFPYYSVKILHPLSNINITGTIPKNNKITIYRNGYLPGSRLSIGSDPDDFYISGLSGINFNADKTFGFDAKVTDFFVKQKPDNITGLECRFSDSFNSEFSYIGYNHDGQKPGLYDYLMEIRKNGNLLFSKVLSPYYADVELDFPNGTYDVTVSPAYENELYNEHSNFTLIVNNDLIERISLVYKTGN